jgi:hypothetical protein
VHRWGVRVHNTEVAKLVQNRNPLHVTHPRRATCYMLQSSSFLLLLLLLLEPLLSESWDPLPLPLPSSSSSFEPCVGACRPTRPAPSACKP